MESVRREMECFPLAAAANEALEMYSTYARPVLVSGLKDSAPMTLLLTPRGKAFNGTTLGAAFKQLQIAEAAPWVTNNNTSMTYMQFRHGYAQASYEGLVEDVGRQAAAPAAEAAARAMGHTARTQADHYTSNRRGVLYREAIRRVAAQTLAMGAAAPQGAADSDSETCESSTCEESLEGEPSSSFSGGSSSDWGRSRRDAGRGGAAGRSRHGRYPRAGVAGADSSDSGAASLGGRGAALLLGGPKRRRGDGWHSSKPPSEVKLLALQKHTRDRERARDLERQEAEAERARARKKHARRREGN